MKKINLIFILLLTTVIANAQIFDAKISSKNQKNEVKNSPKTSYLSENFDTGQSDWTIQNLSGYNWDWSNSATQTLNGTGYMYANSGDPFSDVGSNLISPEINTTGATNLFLAYDVVYVDYFPDPTVEVTVDVYDAVNSVWVTIFTYDHEGDVGDWGSPVEKIHNISAYASPGMKVRFHFYGNYDVHMGVDNIEIYQAFPHEMGITGVSQLFYEIDNPAYPQISVFNYGTEIEQDFSATITINDGLNDIFTSTKDITGANLYPTYGTNLTFDDAWTPTEKGTYYATVELDLAGDGNLTNNTYEADFVVVSAVDGYAWNTLTGGPIYAGAVNFHVPTGDFSNIGGTEIDGERLWGADWAEGRWLGAYNVWDGTSHHFYFVEVNPATGDVTQISTLPYDGSSGVTGGFNTFAYDKEAGVGYTLSYMGYLYQVDITTGATTLIGQTNNGTYFEGLVCDNLGQLYAAGRNDNFYAIDKTNANSTFIGALNIDWAYQGDLAYDRDNDIIYASILYDFEDPKSGFFYIDRQTGAANFLEDMSYDVGVETYLSANCGIALTYTTVAPLNLVQVTPENNATNVLLDANVAATFDANILGVNLSNIQISDGSQNFTTNAIINGTELSIIHTAFEENTTYTVTIPAGAVENNDGSQNEEIIWSFTTTSLLDIVDVVPNDTEVNVSLSADVYATFDANITEIDLSAITITNSQSNVLSGVSASITDATINIAHDDFSENEEYTVTIPAGTVQNSSGSENSELVWSFTTISLLDVVDVVPNDTEVNVSLSADVYATFDANITEIDLSAITITDSQSNVLSGVSASITDATINIAHDDFSENEEYTVTIPAGAVQNASGSENSEIVWTFTTISVLQVLEIFPENQAIDVSLNSQVYVVFDADVFEIDFSGILIEDSLSNTLGGVTAEIVDDTLFIYHDNFVEDMEYIVTIPSGTVSNGDGSFNSDYSWSFKIIEVENVTELSYIDFSIFPNPSNGKFSIISENSIDKVNIYDIRGNLLLSTNKKYDLIIDQKGVYIVEVIICNRKTSKKVIIK